jgi:hypothetical protein
MDAGGSSPFPMEGVCRWQPDPDHDLGAVEFIRRFLLHVLPSGFVPIRHFGFLANRKRKEKLALCRSLLAAPQIGSRLSRILPAARFQPLRNSCPGAPFARPDS